MLKLLRRLRNLILDIILPIECLNCGLEGEYLCPKCFSQLSFSDEKYLKPARVNLKINELKKIYIAGDFENSILHNLIIKYKYNFISPLGKILADFLIIFWQKTFINNVLGSLSGRRKNFSAAPFLVIPIPLSKKRERWRGFNQAEILAREFSVYFGYKLCLNLKRIKHKKPQAALNEAERLENMKNTFVWQDTNKNQPGASENIKKNLGDYTIILVDDVITTGATLNEAARVLKSAGAKKIYGLVLAKG